MYVHAHLCLRVIFLWSCSSMHSYVYACSFNVHALLCTARNVYALSLCMFFLLTCSSMHFHVCECSFCEHALSLYMLSCACGCSFYVLLGMCMLCCILQGCGCSFFVRASTETVQCEAGQLLCVCVVARNLYGHVPIFTSCSVS